MITHKTKWRARASAQGGLWENYLAAGLKASQQGNYPEAEKHLAAAVKEAEGFGPQDPRLATCLFGLASHYHAQGQYAEAEPLYKRAVAIVEKALGQSELHGSPMLLQFLLQARREVSNG